MDFRQPPSLGTWWLPYIYQRPKYFIIATPIGSRHINLPLEDFLVAVVFTLCCVGIALYFLYPRRYCCCCCCCSFCSFCSFCSSSSSSGCKTKRTRKKVPRPVLVITDIGCDIDDTLALCAINGLRRLNKIQLVGVATSGGNNRVRARVARGWLRTFQIADDDVMVAPCSTALPNGGDREECYVPEGTPTFENASLYQQGQGTAAELILSLATTYAGKLEIFVIGPMTPLSNAIQQYGGFSILKKGVKLLHIQGQCKMNERKQRIEPDFASYNLSQDREASAKIFSMLQESIPFRMLGKYAAYQINLAKEEFAQLDHASQWMSASLREERRGKGTETETETETENKKARYGILTTNVLHHLQSFRQQDPSLFDKLCCGGGNVDKGQRLDAEDKDNRIGNDDDDGDDDDDDDNAWFERVTSCSHPYDPLCLLVGLRPSLFRSQKMMTVVRKNGGSTTRSSPSESESSADKSITTHHVVGNTQDSLGVIDIDETKDVLMALMELGLKEPE